jgi:hypothetical protein
VAVGAGAAAGVAITCTSTTTAISIATRILEVGTEPILEVEIARTSGAGTVPPSSPLAAVTLLATGAAGHTDRNIEVAPRIGTGLPLTGLEAVRAEIRWRNARRVPGKELSGRAGIWPAPAAQAAAASATGPAVQASPEELAWATAPVAPVLAARVQVEPIASAVGTSRVPVVETGTPSEAVRGDTTDRARVAAVFVAPPAWHREAEEGSVAEEEASVVAAVGAGDRMHRRR